MRPFADTSFLLAAIDPTDAHHRDASRHLESAGPPAVGREALAELLQLLRYRYRKMSGSAAGLKATRDAVRVLLDELGATVEDGPLDIETVRRMMERHHRLSWPDAAVLVQARGRELWTFDEGQRAVHRSA